MRFFSLLARLLCAWRVALVCLLLLQHALVSLPSPLEACCALDEAGKPPRCCERHDIDAPFDGLRSGCCDHLDALVAASSLLPSRVPNVSAPAQHLLAPTPALIASLDAAPSVTTSSLRRPRSTGPPPRGELYLRHSSLLC